MKRKKDINVFIIGGGGIGKELSRHLSMDGCKVTVIDKDLSVVNELGNSMDVICFQGNGAAGDAEPPAEAFSETGLFRRGRPQIVIAGKGGKRERGFPAKAPVIADQSRKHGEGRGVGSP